MGCSSSVHVKPDGLSSGVPSITKANPRSHSFNAKKHAMLWKQIPSSFPPLGKLDYNTNKSYLELRRVLDEPIGIVFMTRYAKEHEIIYSPVACWAEIQKFVEIPSRTLRLHQAKSVYTTFLDLKGVHYLDFIKGKDVQAVQEAITKQNAADEVVPGLFQEIQSQCFFWIEKNIFRNFVQSDSYRKYKFGRANIYNKVEPNDFDYMKILGKGGFGRVAVVRKKSTGMFYAMKVMSKDSLLKEYKFDLTRLATERNVLVKAHHPYIVHLHYAFQNEKYVFLVLELVRGGDLAVNRRSNGGTLSEACVKFYAAQVVLALHHLHDLNLLYRDLKPRNVLLREDGNVCLADMGLAAPLADGDDETDGTETVSLQSSLADSHSLSPLRRKSDVFPLNEPMVLNDGTVIGEAKQLIENGPVPEGESTPSTSPKGGREKFNLQLKGYPGGSSTPPQPATDIERAETVPTKALPKAEPGQGPSLEAIGRRASDSGGAVASAAAVGKTVSAKSGTLNQLGRTVGRDERAQDAVSGPMQTGGSGFTLEVQIKSVATDPSAGQNAQPQVASRPNSPANQGSVGSPVRTTRSQEVSTPIGNTSPNRENSRVYPLESFARGHQQTESLFMDSPPKKAGAEPSTPQLIRRESLDTGGSPQAAAYRGPRRNSTNTQHTLTSASPSFTSKTKRRKSSRRFSNVGTAGYRSPEMFTQKGKAEGYGVSVDFWSLGVMICELLTGKKPYQNTKYRNSKKAEKMAVEGPLAIPEGLSPPAADVIAKLLEKDVSKRLGCTIEGSIDDIRNHYFFKGIDWDELIGNKAKPPFIPIVEPLPGKDDPPQFRGLDEMLRKFDEQELEHVDWNKPLVQEPRSVLPEEEKWFEGWDYVSTEVLEMEWNVAKELRLKYQNSFLSDDPQVRSIAKRLTE